MFLTCLRTGHIHNGLWSEKQLTFSFPSSSMQCMAFFPYEMACWDEKCVWNERRTRFSSFAGPFSPAHDFEWKMKNKIRLWLLFSAFFSIKMGKQRGAPNFDESLVSETYFETARIENIHLSWGKRNEPFSGIRSKDTILIKSTTVGATRKPISNNM